MVVATDVDIVCDALSDLYFANPVFVRSSFCSHSKILTLMGLVNYRDDILLVHRERPAGYDHGHHCHLECCCHVCCDLRQETVKVFLDSSRQGVETPRWDGNVPDLRQCFVNMRRLESTTCSTIVLPVTGPVSVAWCPGLCVVLGQHSLQRLRVECKAGKAFPLTAGRPWSHHWCGSGLGGKHRRALHHSCHSILHV